MKPSSSRHDAPVQVARPARDDRVEECHPQRHRDDEDAAMPSGVLLRQTTNALPPATARRHDRWFPVDEAFGKRVAERQDS